MSCIIFNSLQVYVGILYDCRVSTRWKQWERLFSLAIYLLIIYLSIWISVLYQCHERSCQLFERSLILSILCNKVFGFEKEQALPVMLDPEEIRAPQFERQVGMKAKAESLIDPVTVNCQWTAQFIAAVTYTTHSLGDKTYYIDHVKIRPSGGEIIHDDERIAKILSRPGCYSKKYCLTHFHRRNIGTFRINASNIRWTILLRWESVLYRLPPQQWQTYLQITVLLPLSSNQLLKARTWPLVSLRRVFQAQVSRTL